MWVLIVIALNGDYRTSPQVVFHNFQSEEACKQASGSVQNLTGRVNTQQSHANLAIVTDCKKN